MTPDDYIPLCEKLGWPEWTQDGLRMRLVYYALEGVWVDELWGGPPAGIWHEESLFCAHVALCILEKWAREKLAQCGLRVLMDDITEGRCRWSVSRWGPFGFLHKDGRTWVDCYNSTDVGDWPTEAEAQIAALKTLCKETDDGEAHSPGSQSHDKG